MTGGNGFLGKAVVAALVRHGATLERIFTPTSQELDLTIFDNCRKAVFGKEIVIHLAARVGGIGANAEHPGKFFYENAIMGIQLIEAARQAKVKKFVSIGTICSYPENPSIPFKEDDLWNGYPTPVTAPYGLAKKMLLVQGQAYKQEYDFDSIYLLPTNLYGPGDDFSLDHSHVIAALIRKIVTAVRNNELSVEVWGSGSATRDFLYIDDAAEGIVQALEKYEGIDPVNLGSGREVSIKELAQMIAERANFTGELRWDSSKPDGQMRRKLDISRAQDFFSFAPKISFEEGLNKTIEWYKNNVK